MKKAVLLALLTLSALLVPANGARAAEPLTCNHNGDPIGTIVGQGVLEQRPLNNDLFIPAHTAECPDAVGKISFKGTSERQAIEDFQSRRIHWIGLNAPLTADEFAVMATSRNHPGLRASTFFHLPILMNGFVVVANVTACPTRETGVRLTPWTLSLIYSGVATTWGHEEIVKQNPTLAGCTQRIAVGVRDGAAWANHALKDYMSKKNPVFTAYKQRELIASWPGALDIACRGTSDIGMATCAAGAGAISYLSYKTAKSYGLEFAQLENGSGKYPPPAGNSTHTWPSNCPAAVPVSSLDGYPPINGDWSMFSVTYRPAGYALCGMSYVLAFGSSGGANPEWEAGEIWNLKDHLLVMAKPEVQAKLKSYGYAPVPEICIRALEGAATGMN